MEVFIEICTNTFHRIDTNKKTKWILDVNQKLLEAWSF